MEKRFGQQNLKEKYVQELRALKRTQGEPISALESRLRVIMTRAFGPKWQNSDHGQFNAMEHFLTALDDHSLELRIRDKDPLTLDDAVKLAIKLEVHSSVSSTTEKSAPLSVKQTSTTLKKKSGNSRIPNRLILLTWKQSPRP